MRLQGFITHSFRGSQGIVSALEFHPDPKRLWLVSSAAADCQVRVWDLFAKKYVRCYGARFLIARAVALIEPTH